MRGLHWFPPIAGMLAKKASRFKCILMALRSWRIAQTPSTGDTISGPFVPGVFRWRKSILLRKY
jgi:hypothetical protein